MKIKKEKFMKKTTTYSYGSVEEKGRKKKRAKFVITNVFLS